MEITKSLLKIITFSLIIASLIQLLRKWKMVGKEIVCPKCEYKGLPEIKTEGNTLLAILLLLLGVIPGAFYFLLFMKSHHFCPKCKFEIRKI